MPSSLRWTLISWFGLLLAAVIVAFGATLHGQVSHAVLAGVDATIESQARAIVGALEWDDEAGWELDLSDEHLRGVAAGGWFRVEAADGAVIRSGGPVPTLAHDGPAGFHEGADVRELRMAGPRGTQVRVGRSIEPERAALRALLGGVIAAGLVLLFVALAGGWWLATRTLGPIDRMSRAARGVSEHDLSQRIDPEDVPLELRELAHTLNDAFERLEQAFRRQARFTADASHELRTPLSVIRAQSELALRRDRTDEEYRAALTACVGAARRMNGIVDGLLALARADAGSARVSRMPLALDEVAREAVEEAALAAQERSVTVRMSAEPLMVEGNAGLLAEVVSNLVTNAIRHNRPGGSVDVRLRSQDDAAVLEVTDDGPGIPADALPRIFERFFRVDDSRERTNGGAGLGLSITRWIVEMHGGTIRVESRLGEGTTFEVVLPAGSRNGVERDEPLAAGSISSDGCRGDRMV